MQNNQPRKKGFSFLSFFLGFLFGIIVLIGSVAGVAYYALSGKVDDVLNMVGVDNSKDENGKNKVINSDKENGGVETLLELVQTVASYASDMGNLSVGQVENLIPAVGGMVDGLHGAISAYIPVERDEFTAVKFSGLGEFVQNKVLDIRPATLFDSLGMGGMLDNKIMQLVFVGKEAGYAVNGEEKYPVYYDVFKLSEGTENTYLREGDGVQLPEEYIENLTEEHGEYRLYYYLVGEACYITDKNEDGSFNYNAPAARSAVGAVYSLYNAEYAALTGNYYYDGETKVEVNPITLGTLSNGGFDALNDVYLTELLSSDDEIANKVLGGLSFGDLMSGNVDITSVLNDLHISDFMDIKATDKIMTRLFYNIYDVTVIGAEDEVPEWAQDAAYKGKYKLPEGDGADPICYIDVKSADGETDGTNNITRAYYHDGEQVVEIYSLSIGGLQSGLDVGSLKIGEIMDVSSNKILKHIADSTIDGLPNAVANLSINEIYYDEIYKVPEKKNPDGTTTAEIKAYLYKAVAGEPVDVGEGETKQIKFDKRYLYYEDVNGKMTYVNAGTDNVGKLTEAEFNAGVAAGKVYYTYGKAQGIWEILLHKTVNKGAADEYTSEAVYTLDNLTDMVGNVSNNIQQSTLFDLHDNGIIMFNKRTDLEKVVISSNSDYNDKQLGELRLTQALSYIVEALDKINSLPTT